MNTFLNGTFSVIHSSATTDFNNYVYSGIYCNATTSITVNNQSINCSIGHLIPLIVKQSGTTLNNDFLLLGNVKPNTPATGKLGSGDTYTFVDIRTGNQI